jgi:hypothetical protein
MEKTRKNYESFLNDLYNAGTALEIGEYMLKAKRLLSEGKYGTALRKYDPIAFEIGFKEWK